MKRGLETLYGLGFGGGGSFSEGGEVQKDGHKMPSTWLFWIMGFMSVGMKLSGLIGNGSAYVFR